MDNFTPKYEGYMEVHQTNFLLFLKGENEFWKLEIVLKFWNILVEGEMTILPLKGKREISKGVNLFS